MKLILLSGGSGKRLWPLSNSQRSKQFLPLFENSYGEMESMLQRVVHQIHEANLTDDVIVATNASQLDIITNQLGGSVSVVTEPERRDTFPAIALATTYLRLVKKCDEDEVVVVMPCDPYTDSGYFSTINSMAQCVKNSVAELVLMGISPTYPSEKYGYIISHESSDNSFRVVSKFVEKPDEETARKLLLNGALWNGGVFAFRLGYMHNIVQKYVNARSFEQVLKRYSDFPRISFDYEVVEKAKSVAVVPFRGKWIDLGTWNTLTDELPRNIIGNAMIDGHCNNVHVINEQRCPIYVSGVDDIVVAACNEGILVCGKNSTEQIKDAVDKLNSMRILGAEEHARE